MVAADVDFKYAPLTGKSVSGTGKYQDTGLPEMFEKGVGTGVASAIAGDPWNAFQGGVAPGAKIAYTDAHRASSYDTLFKYAGARVLSIGVRGNSPTGDRPSGVVRAEATADGRLDFFRRFRDAGGVVIHSAGFSGVNSKEPTDNASLPYHFQNEDMSNWITTVALSETFVSLEDWSAQCGVMAGKCIAAPGTWRVPWPTAGQPADFSFRWVAPAVASGLVAGTAALVKEKFPWMTGGQIAHTILSTAKDIGAPGVDEVFGRGVLDAGKAVKGPGSVTGAFAASIPEGQVAEFSNAISGDGSIVKDGAGRLILSGDNTYTGGTVLKAGSLSINSLNSGINQSGGLLAGTGRIGGDLIQSSGVLSLTSGSSLQVDGRVSLNGAVEVTPGAGFTGRSEGVVLTARDGVDGSITSSQSSLFHSSTARILGNGIVATVVRTSGADGLSVAGLGDKSTAVGAAAVDALLKASDAGSQAKEGMVKVANELRADASAVSVLDSLSGQAHATSRGAVFSASEGRQRRILSRAQEAGASEKGGVWVQFGGQGNRISDRSGFDADVSENGVVAGADRRFGDHLVAGVSVSSSRTDSEFDRLAGSVRSSEQGVGVYASASPSDQWSVSAHAGLGKVKTDLRRGIIAGGVTQADVRTQGDLLSAGLRVAVT